MDAIQRRVLAGGEEVGRAHVGGEHALLDEAVGVVAHLGTICAILPLSSKIMRVSVVSKSIAPRFAAP